MTTIPSAAPPFEARILSIGQLFALGTFRPAAVQREYQWRAGNCETLLADLRRVLDDEATHVDAEDEGGAPNGAAAEDAVVNELRFPGGRADDARIRDYYLGTMVFSPGENGGIDIYDGLQRTATLTILIAMLRDFVTEERTKSRLDALVRNPGGGWRLNLRIGAETLEKEVQRRNEAKRERRKRGGLTASEQRLREVAAYFWSVLKHWREPKLKAFANRLLDRVWVGVIEVVHSRAARHIFISTNLYGKPLDRADVFKGQLLELADSDEAAKLIAQRWEGVQKKLDVSVVAGHEGEVFVWRQRELEPFLVAVDFITRQELQGADCIASLGEHVKATCRDHHTLLQWLHALDRYADAWSQLHDRMARLGGEASDVEIWKLRFFEWPEWKPLALFWYRDYMDRRGPAGNAHHKSLEAFNRRFHALHRRCLALTIAGFEPNERALIIRNAIRQAERGSRDPLTHALAFNGNALAKMRNTLATPITDRALARSLVRWIEASLWSGPPIDELSDGTIEHVLPRRPDQMLGSGAEDDAAREAYFDAVHSLGNLVVLDRPRNRDLVNKSPREKFVRYREPPLFKTVAQVLESEDWTAETIAARRDRLIEHVLAEMRLPVFVPRPRRA